MIHLDKSDLEDKIKSGNYLVDFYAEWCGPCKMMTPILESLDSKINIIKVDIDKFPDLAEKYRIMSVPTMMFFKEGTKKDEVIGFRDEDEMKEIIDKL